MRSERRLRPTRPWASTSASSRGAAAAALIAVALSAAACDKPLAWGDANSLIVVAPDSLWAEVEEDTYAVLEPRIFTTRDENMFVVTQIDPTNPSFKDLKVFRQVLVFATLDDPLLQEASRKAELVDSLGTFGTPTVFQARDVWARGQTVTGVVLRAGQEVDSWLEQLPLVLAIVDSSYREWVRRRMFATPPDTALARELRERFGFSITVPRVYDHVVRAGDEAIGDSIVILRNDNPDPSNLIRSVLISWRPALDSLTAEAAIAWRAAVDSVHYNVPQSIDLDRSAVTEFLHEGVRALEVTGVWSDEEVDFPAAGPFIVWSLQCPGRTFFIDAWLYAPDESKYEYMLQLQEILDSFRCTS